MNQLLTKQEAAKSLRICEKTLEKKMKEKKIKVIRIGRRVLFRPKDIDKFIEDGVTPKSLRKF